MKGKLKKIFISVGKVFMIAFLAAFLIFAACYCFFDEKQTETIRTKAEEVSPTADSTQSHVSSGIDLSKYPTVNLISYPYVDKTTTKNGVTFTVNNDGTVNVNGTATARCEFSLSNYVPVTVGASYFFSGCPVGGGSNTFIFFLYDGMNGFADKGDGMKVVAKVNFFILKIIVYTGVTVDNVVFKPMLNSGDVAYPYSPPYDLIYNQGYQEGENAGHEAGYQEGHDDGYTEGYDACWDIAYAQGYADGKKDGYDVGYEEGFAAGYNDGYGKAVDVLATGLLTKGNASYINKQLAPSGSGISCNAYSDYFTYSYAASYSGLLYLNCARSYSNGYKLKIKVNEVTVETVFSAMLLDLETNSSAMYEVFRLPVVSTATTYEVTVSLPVSTTRSFKSFVITPASVPSGGTIKGLEIEVVGSEKDYYDNGYAEGQKFGYDSGYTKGYAMGKSDAMSQMSDSDLPSSVRSFVFSLFDAPVTSFLSAFNLSYDGFDLGALVSFIFTAIVIVGVIRIVT